VPETLASQAPIIEQRLNDLQAAGTVASWRAALGAGLTIVSKGFEYATHLSVFGATSPSDAEADLDVIQGELQGEYDLLAGRPADDVIDADTLERQRRSIDRAIIAVAGIQGEANYLDSVDWTAEFTNALALVPKAVAAAAAPLAPVAFGLGALLVLVIVGLVLWKVAA
jgi:hypothetical protein